MELELEIVTEADIDTETTNRNTNKQQDIQYYMLQVMHIFFRIPTSLLIIVVASVKVINEVDYFCIVTDYMQKNRVVSFYVTLT